MLTLAAASSETAPEIVVVLPLPVGARRDQHALAPVEDLSQSGQIAGREPQRRQVGGRVARIEQAQHRLFAFARGDCGHPHRELGVAPLQREASVLRAAAHRDVEAGHDLHPRDGRAMASLRELGGGRQHAVDAQPHARPVSPGFDVHVAGATLDGVRQDVVHDPDDRCGGRLLLQVRRPAAAAAAIIDRRARPQPVQQFRQLFAVRRLHSLRQGRGGRDHRLDVASRPKGQVVDQRGVEGVGHRNGKAAALDREGQHALRPGQRRVDLLQGVLLGVERRGRAAQVEVGRESLRHAGLAHHAPAEQDIAQAAPRTAALRLRFFERSRGERAALQQHLAEKVVVGGHRPGKLGGSGGVAMAGWDRFRGGRREGPRGAPGQPRARPCDRSRGGARAPRAPLQSRGVGPQVEGDFGRHVTDVGALLDGVAQAGLDLAVGGQNAVAQA